MSIPRPRWASDSVSCWASVNQRVAAAADRVTLMVAGLPVHDQGQPGRAEAPVSEFQKLLDRIVAPDASAGVLGSASARRADEARREPRPARGVGAPSRRDHRRLPARGRASGHLHAGRGSRRRRRGRERLSAGRHGADGREFPAAAAPRSTCWRVTRERVSSWPTSASRRRWRRIRRSERTGSDPGHANMSREPAMTRGRRAPRSRPGSRWSSPSARAGSI